MTRWRLAMVLCTACNPAPAPGPSLPPPSADIVLRGVTLRNFHGSAPHLVATMPRLELMRVSTELRAEQVNARMASGVTISAKRVTGNANEGRIEGHDGVAFASPSGITGDAPSATYEKALGPRGGAHGDQGVHLEHPQFTVDARSFTADFVTERVDFDAAITRLKGNGP